MKLPEDFERRVFLIFSPEEMSEPLIMVYQYLNKMVLLECNKMILSCSELRWLSGDNEKWKFPMIYGDHSLYDIHKECFRKVFERDNLVQKFFQDEVLINGELIIKINRLSDID